MSEQIRSGAKDVKVNKIGLLSVIAMFYSMCCAGAYGVEEMIPEAGPGLTMLILVVLPLVWALPYSYICAELGSARPSEGGKIMWVKEALGEYWYAIMVILNFIWGLVANTVYVILAVDYFGFVTQNLFDYELPGVVSFVLKAVLVLIFFVINVLGLKEVSIVSTILSIAIVVAFGVVAVVGLMHWEHNPFVPFISGEYGDGPSGFLGSLGAGFAIGIWMYSGFDEISMVGGEIKGSEKLIPKALMIVIPLMMFTYLLPTIGGLSSIGDWSDWTTEPDGVGYANVLKEFIHPVAGAIFAMVAIIGQCSIFNVCIMTASRSGLMLADLNFGPPILARLSKHRGTPYISLIIVAVVSIILIPFGFVVLVVVDVFFSIAVCALVVVSALILKNKISPDEFKFKMPGGKPVHRFACGLVLVLCVFTILVNGADYFLGGMFAAFLMPILYMIFKRAFGGATKDDPVNFPVNPATGFGFGDLKKIGGSFLFVGAFSFVGRVFVYFYEREWADEYYLDEYGLHFDTILWGIVIVGAVAVVAGAICLGLSTSLDKKK